MLGLALERRMLQELAGFRVEGRQAGHEHHVPSPGADRDGSAPFLKIGVERFDSHHAMKADAAEQYLAAEISAAGE
jgi:hypothetical protein